MTIGAIAGLIAALALLILVIYVAWFLVHLMGAVNEAVANVGQLTKDVNVLSTETEAILKNSNRLLDDLNEKAEQVTPVVQAMADVGQSVSDVNQASRDFVEKLNEAGKWADFAFKVGFEAVKVGVSEQDVAAELEFALKKHGIREMSFDTLVQAGPHAAEPHGETSERQIENNQLVLFDLGTVFEGYISDASRTVGVGDPTAKQREIYQVCLEAQLAAQAAARPGITAAELDQVARKIIDRAGYGQYFIHRLGHGMGMSEHEFPSIMEGNDLVLEPGMCFSLEPGIYIPGVAGVRIEDCVHVTEDGCQPFTHTSKDFQIVG